MTEGERIALKWTHAIGNGICMDLAAEIDAALEKARIYGFDQGAAWEQHEAHDKKHGKY